MIRLLSLQCMHNMWVTFLSKTEHHLPFYFSLSKAALMRGAKQMANIHAHDSIDIMSISPGRKYYLTRVNLVVV